jgi:hypothetical protein
MSANAWAEDFALMEASCAVIRILQAFPALRIASSVASEAVGMERQVYTIGLYPEDGVWVEVG